MKNITHISPEDAAAILQVQKLAYQSEAQLYNDITTLGKLRPFNP